MPALRKVTAAGYLAAGQLFRHTQGVSSANMSDLGFEHKLVKGQLASTCRMRCIIGVCRLHQHSAAALQSVPLQPACRLLNVGSAWRAGPAPHAEVHVFLPIAAAVCTQDAPVLLLCQVRGCNFLAWPYQLSCCILARLLLHPHSRLLTQWCSRQP